MHFSTILLSFALGLGVTANSVSEPKPLPRGVSHALKYRQLEGGLSPRDTPDIDPAAICGVGFKDCGDGWCCTSSQQCAGKIEDIPVCKDPTVTAGILRGTAVALPYNNLDEKLSSLEAQLAELTAAPRAGGDSTSTANTNSKETGAAAALRANDMGMMAAIVAGIWGVAALGGAGLLLL